MNNAELLCNKNKIIVQQIIIIIINILLYTIIKVIDACIVDLFVILTNSIYYNLPQ